MRIFGLEIRRAEKLLSPVSEYRGGWRNILESFTGAWQAGVEETRGDLLTYPTLYACQSRIASDVGKLPFTLRSYVNGISVVTSNVAYDAVLKKPNPYQTPAQFREYWILTKLVFGNAYILKRRDNRGVVNGMYVLNPERVVPMVSDAGFVYYQLQTNAISTLPNGYPAEGLIVPASEVMHDRCMTIHHPLIGVPPVAAANWPATKNLKILRNATKFFANNAQPGGILTGPVGMKESDAEKIKDYWTTNFTGDNVGKVAIIGADMKFTSFAVKSIDSQMVEQMRYSDEQICQPFGIPPFKVGIGTIPTGLGVDGVNLLYYNDALQTHIEHMESLLDEGLKISAPLGIELDLDPLLRMDAAKRAEVEVALVGGKIKTPDEGRACFNLAPTDGGSTLWGQHQDYPLGVLATRNDLAPVAAPVSQPVSDDIDDEDMMEQAKSIIATEKAISGLLSIMQPEVIHV